jgi:hypothetical protein
MASCAVRVRFRVDDYLSPRSALSVTEAEHHVVRVAIGKPSH